MSGRCSAACLNLGLVVIILASPIAAAPLAQDIPDHLKQQLLPTTWAGWERYTQVVGGINAGQASLNATYRKNGDRNGPGAYIAITWMQDTPAGEHRRDDMLPGRAGYSHGTVYSRTKQIAVALGARNGLSNIIPLGASRNIDEPGNSSIASEVLGTFLPLAEAGISRLESLASPWGAVMAPGQPFEFGSYRVDHTSRFQRDRDGREWIVVSYHNGRDARMGFTINWIGQPDPGVAPGRDHEIFPYSNSQSLEELEAELRKPNTELVISRTHEASVQITAWHGAPYYQNATRDQGRQDEFRSAADRSTARQVAQRMLDNLRAVALPRASAAPPAPTPDVGEPAGRVVYVEGDVQVERNGQRQPVQAGDTLRVGDTIVTGADGLARVEIETEAGVDIVDVAADTTLATQTAAGSGASVVVEAWGDIRWVRPPSDGIRQPANIILGNVIGSIRGTELIASYRPGGVRGETMEAIVYVQSGDVGLSNSAGDVIGIPAGHFIRAIFADITGDFMPLTQMERGEYEEAMEKFSIPDSAIPPRNRPPRPPEFPPADRRPVPPRRVAEGLPPGAEVMGLLFFESGADTPPRAQRQYGERFDASARYISWEIRLRYPEATRERRALEIETVVTREGQPFARFTSETGIEAGWFDSHHSSSWGSREGGTWAPGTYDVELSVGGRLVARGSFLVAGGRQ